jgi:hypothetical protein
MVRSKPLSNRQRKAASKAVPKAARAARGGSPSVTVRSEPKGVAAQVAVRDEVVGREMARLAAGGAEDLDMKVESVGGEDMVHVSGAGRHGERRGGAGLRLCSRDGLLMLHRSGALTDDQVKAGLAFRLCYELAETALGSCLGRVGEGRGGRDWSQLSVAVTAEGELALLTSATDLHRAYVIARLNQIERAVYGLADPEGRVWLAKPDGRELGALRQIAGEGLTVRNVAGGSGHARAATVAALGRALSAIASLLRITGQ